MLNGRVAWITGATGGVGPAVVKALAGAGTAIIATARNETALEALRTQFDIPDDRWLALPVDLTDAEAVRTAVGQALTSVKQIDILVAVAGGWRGGTSVAETEPATVDWLFRTNLLTAFNACRAVLPHMTERGWGRIITMSARSALTGQARSGAYAASKAALLAMTQSISAETRQSGVTANTILISTVDTPDNRESMPAADRSRWVSPEQIAAAVRFLCSTEAGAISGAAVPVYGRA